MRLLMTMLLILIAGAVAADDLPPGLPAFYDVRDVAADDRLNIRAQPDAGAPIVGTLAHDRQRIEVTAFSRGGGWGRVNTKEGSGWASLRFLTRQSIAPGLTALTCFGTEPFWSISFAARDTILYSTPAGEARHPVDAPPAMDLIGDPLFVGTRFSWRYAGTPATGLILPGQCADGMSDRYFALHFVDLALGLNGCCSLR